MKCSICNREERKTGRIVYLVDTLLINSCVKCGKQELICGSCMYDMVYTSYCKVCVREVKIDEIIDV